MADLTARSAAAGLLPETIGTMTLSEAEDATLTALLPYHGKMQALADAVGSELGLSWPERGRFEDHDGATLAWLGLDQWLLIGAAANADWSNHAALTDQGDAWCRLRLEGPDLAEVLARLVPVDLSLSACPPGTALRAPLGHMACLSLRRSEHAMEMCVFRSMAGSAVHDLTRAMRMVALRAGA